MKWSCLALCLLLAPAANAADTALPEDSITWRAEPQELSVSLQACPLDRMLQRLAKTTGWQIFVEPDTRRTITTRFASRPVGQALQHLLGELNFALVPQGTRPSKLFVFRTALARATKKIEGDADPKPIPNELIVRLKPGANIDEIAKALGARVAGRAEGLNLYRLVFDDKAAAENARGKLAENQSVAAVENNFEVPNPGSYGPSGVPGRAWNLLPKAVGSSEQVIVGLIDTAIQKTGGPLDQFLLPTISIAGEVQTPNTALAHATGMGENIMTAAALSSDGQPSPIRILPVDVYGASELSSTYAVAVGIYEAINAGAMIINLSLGSEAPTGYLDQVIQSGYDQGVAFFAAAGNTPVSTPTYPAANPLVTAVTATDPYGNLSPWANHGDFIDVGAPGAALVHFGGQSWIITGTSPATVYASGIAAGLATPNSDFHDVSAAVRRALGTPVLTP